MPWREIRAAKSTPGIALSMNRGLNVTGSVSSLSPRGTSGERAGERGNQIKTASSPRPSPPSFLRRRGRSRRFMVPRHAQKRKGAPHEPPPHPACAAEAASARRFNAGICACENSFRHRAPRHHRSLHPHPGSQPDFTHAILAAKRIGSAEGALRVIAPLAVDDEAILVLPRCQRNHGLPDAVLLSLERDRVLNP